ncbi:MAG: diacylglycerol/lipid kinase family protein [Lachnospiraceae bacterium]
MYYFILNPNAKSGGSDSVWNRIKESLARKNIPYKSFVTERAGHGTQIAASITHHDPTATVIAVGGDGSIHDILCGLEHLDTVTFGVIPCGSGNDFARGMGILRKTREAIETVLHPTAFTMMDVAQLTDQPEFRFGVSAGIGFDASICHEALRSPLKNVLNTFHAGNLTYSFLAVKQVIAYKPGPMSIILDDTTRLDFRNVYFASIMNQQYQGGGLQLSPDATPSDRLLDIFVCGDISRAKLLAFLPTAYSGKHTGLTGLHFLRARKVKITADKSRPIHLDGESGGIRRTLSAQLCPNQLKVITG